MGVISNLLTPTTPQNVNSSGTSTTALPSAITGYENAASQVAAQDISTPYKPYQGQMVASPNANQTGAYGLAGGLSQAYAPAAAQAGNVASAIPGMVQGQSSLANNYGGLGVAAAFDPSNSWQSQASNWMNPYTSNVVDQIAKAGNQNFNTQLMPSINSQFIGSGDFNSLDNMGGLAQGAALAQQGITSAQANALQSGYSTGLQGYLSQLGQQVGAANNAAGAANTTGYMGNYGLNAAAGTMSGLGSTALGDLSSTGGNMFNIGQAGTNAALGQYPNAQNWTPQQLASASSSMSSLPWPGTVSGTSNAPLAGAGYGPSTLATVGSGLQAAGQIANSLPSASSVTGGLSSAYNWLTGS